MPAKSLPEIIQAELRNGPLFREDFLSGLARYPTSLISLYCQRVHLEIQRIEQPDAPFQPHDLQDRILETGLFFGVNYCPYHEAWRVFLIQSRLYYSCHLSFGFRKQSFDQRPCLAASQRVDAVVAPDDRVRVSRECLLD